MLAGRSSWGRLGVGCEGERQETQVTPGFHLESLSGCSAPRKDRGHGTKVIAAHWAEMVASVLCGCPLHLPVLDSRLAIIVSCFE